MRTHDPRSAAASCPGAPAGSVHAPFPRAGVHTAWNASHRSQAPVESEDPVMAAPPEVLPYPSAAEHTRDELALVGLFVARAIARGRAQGWLRDGVQPIDVPDEAVFERFRAIEQRLAATRDPLP